jgi:thiopeptide-type bacteriocin biosynthesis protein
MSADQLTALPSATPSGIAAGILNILAGASPNQVAVDLGMNPAVLADAIETYHQAGLAALAADTIRRDWCQVHIEFPDWEPAENTAAIHVGTALERLTDTGAVSAWWFIRKAPCWRLRLKPAQPNGSAVTTAVGSVLDELTSTGVLSGWRRTLYEPEAAAFGGRTGMEIAHRLFHADSAHIMAYLRQSTPTIGRRELSILLCTVLFRGAGQEWFEAGDIWHRVARLRPLPSNVPTDRLNTLAEDLRELLPYDIRHVDSAGPLSFAASWASSFYDMGRALRKAADEGTLERGTRDILAYHVIFHWNRLGLSTTTQSILANTAEAVILGTGAFSK